MWTELPPGLVLIAGAALLALLPRRTLPAAFLVVPAAALWVLSQLSTGERIVYPFLDYELTLLQVDRLGLAFGTVFTLFTLLAGIFGYSLLGRAERVAALLYAGSALGVVFAGDLLTLFVFWEIMAVASVCLIWSRRTAASDGAGFRYLMVHLAGGSVLLAGILIHASQAGSLVLTPLEGGAAAWLILVGFALNAAVPPLHAWLADAYPEATVTGTVLLSAFTTKTAVCVLLRGFAGWEVLVWAGLVMALYGVVFAVLENDIRRLLGYHIISQVGYMVAGVGLGTETAVNGVTAHAFAHILYKGLLLMGAGAVLHATGRSRLTELGGLAGKLPWVLALYMVGAFSISGFPLFSGFVSKSLVIHAAETEHLPWVALLLYLASVGTFLHTGLKLPWFTWFGPPRNLEPSPVPPSMYVGMTLAALLNVAIGVYPDLLYSRLPFPVDYQPYTALHLLQTTQLLLFTAFGFWWLVDKLGGEPTITLDTDWLYRRPAAALYRLVPENLNRLFTAAEEHAVQAARALAALSQDPVRGALRLLPGRRSAEDPSGGEASPFDPDRYRFTLGTMLLVVLAVFVGLLALGLLG